MLTEVAICCKFCAYLVRLCEVTAKARSVIRNKVTADQHLPQPQIYIPDFIQFEFVMFYMVALTTVACVSVCLRLCGCVSARLCVCRPADAVWFLLRGPGQYVQGSEESGGCGQRASQRTPTAGEEEKLQL